MNIVYVQCDYRYNPFLMELIDNTCVIQYTLNKLKKCRYIDKIIINVYHHEKNIELIKALDNDEKITITMSQKESVNERLLEVAKMIQSGYIVRVSAEQIFINEKEIDCIIKGMLETNSQWYYPEYNDGTLADIIKSDVLLLNAKKILEYDRYYKAIKDDEKILRYEYEHTNRLLPFSLYVDDEVKLEVVRDSLTNKKDIYSQIENLERRIFSKESYIYQVGWIRSLLLERLEDNEGNAKPWLNYNVISFLENRIRKEMSIFEFGAGSSTLWWANRVERVTSVEHNKEWFEKVKQSIPNNVKLYFEELEYGGEYSKKIGKYTKEFDIIVIDGRDRVNCAKNCLVALKDEGVIIWDNTIREEYEEGFEYLIDKGFKQLDFYGLFPTLIQADRTSLFYKESNILNI